MNKLLKNQKGFTLVELLVVIAILGVLAAIAIPNFQKFLGAGEEEAAKVELSNVQTMVDAYYLDNDGEYPTPDGKSGDVDWEKVVPDYMRKQPDSDYALDEYGLVSRIES